METKKKTFMDRFLNFVETVGNALLKCTLFTGHPVRRVHFALYD